MAENSRRDVILANPKWVGGRNYYLAVWGEYEPTAGWTYERDMIDRIRLGDWLQPAVGSWAVRAVLRVDGWHRATRWSLSVATTTGVTPVLVDRGTCRSIREAQRVAGERLLSFDLPAFLRGVFKEDSAFWYHAYADGEHVASVNDLYLLPSGDYFVRRGAHTMKVQRWFGGYSTSRAEAS